LGERLWFDLVQEEIGRNTRDVVTSKSEKQENFDLARKLKKVKGKKAQCKEK